MIVTLSALAVAGMQIAEPIEVRATSAGGKCGVIFEGRPRTAKALQALAQGWARTQPQVTILAEGEAAYRCIGAVIFTIQMAGVARIGFLGNDVSE